MLLFNKHFRNKWSEVILYIRIYYVVNLKRSTPRQEEITRPVNAVLKSVFVKTQ